MGLGSLTSGFLCILGCILSLLGGFTGSFRLGLGGFASSFFFGLLLLLSLPLCLFLVREAMELDAWLDLGLLHLIGVGEGEGAKQVDTFATDIDIAFGNSTITLQSEDCVTDM